MPKRSLKIPYSGTTLLEMSLLNKGTAFSPEERDDLHLHGLLPQTVETIEEQASRVHFQYLMLKSEIDKHIYLRNLQDTNETLFYYILRQHLETMLPVVYTPTVGEACQRFSEIYRAARGIFVSYPNRHRIDELLANVTKRNVKVIVVTDGERILGLGDQGIGGMGISIGKLSLYSACGGISPAYTLPVVLDSGTNNQLLLGNPMYMGWKNPRISGEEYDDFIEAFILAVQRRWPNCLLQFEDFAQRNAAPLLSRYRERICCFNDDIQGTAAVTLASVLSAVRSLKQNLRDQRFVFFGAGSAGCGIAHQIASKLMREGLNESEARSRIFMVDRFGLLTTEMPNLLPSQAPFAKNPGDFGDRGREGTSLSLLTTVEYARPTVLIGTSGQPGLFTEAVVRAMNASCERPIILPLSNPDTHIEARPEDIIRWTQGSAIVATGSPFFPVSYEGQIYEISQCNNSYIFPGLGLGVLSSGARIITDEMIMAASEALAKHSPLANDGNGSLLPSMKHIDFISQSIAEQVALTAQNQGVAAKTSYDELLKSIASNTWRPEYRPYSLQK